ncbi:sarcosine oxidase subunit gamma [Sphingomonas oleivorans]|uniref:Sarcosine oxidase subunit gamma n=1 Tax=Sphingomonas oleivorans TaxID=1735121 RepID=A0A2T5G0Q4_9SPHN|nr:sarcosine oxidase subunit gamma family protein [Sphingomonas oleivorans]PTQ12727.1 sarcosine oxidase subunit gamma [Sphingomonas oleivorans]
MADLFLPAEGAFAPFLETLSPSGNGRLVLSEPPARGIATVMARAGQGAALATRMKALYGIDVEDAARFVTAGDVALVGTGPGAWLMLREGAAPDWAAQPAGELDGLASVFDQSSGYAVLRLGGAGAATLLSRGAFIDMHPRAFPVGAAAVTVMSHIGAILWQREAAVYEVAIFRSYAASFWHWIAATAAANGLTPMRSA